MDFYPYGIYTRRKKEGRKIKNKKPKNFFLLRYREGKNQKITIPKRREGIH